MLDVVVVSNQMNVEVISIFCVIGVVNEGVLIELLNCLCAGLIGQGLE